MSCDARQYSDQKYCATCGLTWDMNDQDPPPCNPIKRPPAPSMKVINDEVLAQLRSQAKQRNGATITAEIPVELPDSLATEMYLAMRYAVMNGSSEVGAMKRAYRLFLDRLP